MHLPAQDAPGAGQRKMQMLDWKPGALRTACGKRSRPCMAHSLQQISALCCCGQLAIQDLGLACSLADCLRQEISASLSLAESLRLEYNSLRLKDNTTKKDQPEKNHRNCPVQRNSFVGGVLPEGTICVIAYYIMP